MSTLLYIGPGEWRLSKAANIETVAVAIVVEGRGTVSIGGGSPDFKVTRMSRSIARVLLVPGLLGPRIATISQVGYTDLGISQPGELTMFRLRRHLMLMARSEADEMTVGTIGRSKKRGDGREERLRGTDAKQEISLKCATPRVDWECLHGCPYHSIAPYLVFRAQLPSGCKLRTLPSPLREPSSSLNLLPSA